MLFKENMKGWAMKRLGLVALLLVLLGCGGPQGLTSDEQSELYNWCLEHYGGSPKGCNRALDIFVVEVNDRGIDEACAVRAFWGLVLDRSEVALEGLVTADHSCGG